MTANIEAAGNLLKITSDFSGVTRIYCMPAKDFDFRLLNEICFIKILSDSQEFNFNMPVVNVSVNNVAAASGADLITKISTLINF